MKRRHLAKAIKRISHLPRNKNLLIYLLNKARHFFLIITKSTKVAYPNTIMLELTNQCNLHCSTCPREYKYGSEMDRGSMNVNEAKKIIEGLWPYLDSIGLSGLGESFLYKELEEVIDFIHSKNKGIIISISTNAILPGFLEKARKLIGKADTIQISIDGLGTIYNTIRIGAKFEELDKNLKELVRLASSSKTTLMLNMVITKENYSQLSELIEYADRIGIKYLDFTVINLVSLTNTEVSYYNFFSSDEFVKEFTKAKVAKSISKNVTVEFKNFTGDKGFHKCPFPWTHFYISWDGFIPPCCGKPFPKETNFGNVFNTDIMNILNSKSYQQFRKSWYKNETQKFCAKCHFIDLDPIEV